MPGAKLDFVAQTSTVRLASFEIKPAVKIAISRIESPRTNLEFLRYSIFPKLISFLY
jgi:hypothetical protein